MDNSDVVQEGPGAPPIDGADSRGEWAKANLAALAVLLNLDGDDNSFRDLFRALGAVFTFDRALVLGDSGEAVYCIAAMPAVHIGRRWPDKSLLESLQVLTKPAGSGWDAQSFPDVLTECAVLDEPALCVPIGFNGHPALLVLVRLQGQRNFSDHHLAVAKQYATVALAMLVTRKGAELEAENQRLTAIVQHSCPDVQCPQYDGQLLKEIIDELPISLTVQDDTGRFVIANTMAAANLGMPADHLIGASPADFLPSLEAASRREWEQNLIRQHKTVIVETNVADQSGDRTWMISHKPIRILDRMLLLSSSIDITERKQVERELAERSHVDKLTKLPDRVLIQEYVDTIVRNADDGSRFALAFIDLDNFKHINDYYNHAVGDGLLVKFSQRISKQLRPRDVLARISGDEFLLLLEPFEGEDQIRSIIDGILQSLKQPFQIEAFEVFGSCSIGVSIYPEHGRDYDTLRRNADSAMYRAKRQAKGNAVFFDLNMAQTVAARMQAEQRLRLAIRDRKFCCAFQPKVDIHSQQVVGFETLVRWRDDDGEIQPPSEFIGLAIELGLINPITDFVLAEAVNSFDRLDAAFGPDTTISVNVAAKQANDLEFMSSFAQALRYCNRADRIIIELTEDAFIGKGSFQTQSLSLLREIGVRISIDDFGTGYSSLSALADITADEIKIDRSFISGIHERPRNQSVLRAIESLGHALGMSIIAEGVETFEELAYLQAATRIRYVQGFYFAKPFYLEDLSDAAQVITRSHEAARVQSGTLGRHTASRLVAPVRSSW